jgi:hypothetical protein
MALGQDMLRDLARAGARAKLFELQQELDWIRQSFPELGSKDGRSTGTDTLSSPTTPSPMSTPVPRKRRKMSAAGRHAIAAAQRARWAAIKAAKTSKTSRPRMSDSARKAVSARMKKYWAKRRREAAK